MSRNTIFVGLAILAVFCLVAPVAAQVTLAGPTGRTEALNPGPVPEGSEQLFRGDLVAEQGIGCSNSAGTSGGPNDFAVGVTASLPTPLNVVSTTYNLFTQVSPTITSLSFVAWGGGATPGAELGRQIGIPFSQGNHTAAVSGVSVPSAQFYFGLNQMQSNVGLRVGLDSSSGSAGTSFIRAPTCGAVSFATVDSLGFPGNWVMAAVVEDAVPVELMTLDVE
ncbi:MAG: hypothetical protein R2991_16060 [Thermoanaerobaculia bacterium]